MNGPILVILPHNPGDVVMALQAIRRVKAEFPGLEVDYLVGEECRELVQGSPLIRNAICIPKRALKDFWRAGDAEGIESCLEGFLAGLASVRYALSANLFQERSGGLIQSWVQADAKIGLEFVDQTHFRVRSRFLEHLFAIPAHRAGNAWHVVDLYARALLRALDPTRPLGEAPVPPPASAGKPSRGKPPVRRAENAISPLPPLIRPEAGRNLSPGEYLAFHPGSAWAGKRWPEAHWAALATRCARAGFTLAFTGAREEKPIMQRILAAMDPADRGAVADCVGETSLLGAAWIASHARMVVTGDTVAMHLAAAAGASTLCLFGASNPVETGPYGKGHVLIQTDANPLPELAFDQPHAGLGHLLPDEVAGYLLEGILPPGFAVWETGWDARNRMQILSDAKRLPHPNLEGARKLMRELDGAPDPSRARPEAHSAPEPAGSGAKLLSILEKSAAEPKPENLAALEAAEREWAEETSNSLIWEAYRIAVNGLPMGDIPSHLQARQARFRQALREAGPIPAPGH